MTKKITITKTLVVAVHKFKVVLKMPTTNDGYLTTTKGIYKATTNTTKFATFPTADAALTPAIYLADITAYDNAESDLKLKPPVGTAKGALALKKVLEIDNEMVRLGVQVLVNASPKNAATIATKAAMYIELIATHGAKGGSAKKGTVANTWDIIAEGPGPHQFEITTDQKTWTLFGSSRTKKITTGVLTRGVDYFVRTRQELAHGKHSDWSASIELNN